MGPISFRSRLMTAIGAVVLLTAACSLFAAMYYFTRYVNRSAADRVMSAMNELATIIKHDKERALTGAVLLASNPNIVEAVERRDRTRLLGEATPLVRQAGIQFATITDKNGVVLARTHEPGRLGDNVSNQMNISAALKGQTLSAVEEGTVVKLSARSGAPIRNQSGEIIGAVSAGFRTDKDEFCDIIKKQYHVDTIMFLNNRSVAASILRNGRRTTNICLPSAIAAEVLGQGQAWNGDMVVRGVKYTSAVIPIVNYGNKPIGAIFAGLPVQERVDVRNATFGAVIVSIFVVLLAGFFFSWVLSSRLTVPIDAIVANVQRIAQGDLTRRLNIVQDDELGRLGNSINAMTEQLNNLHENLRESAEYYRALIENSSDITMVLDQEGRLLYGSPAIKRVLGYDPDSLVGKPVNDYMESLPNNSAVGELLHRQEDSRPNYVEYPIRHADGSVRILEGVGSVVKTGRFSGIIVNSRDITERKLAAEHIEQLNEELEQRVRDRTAELEESLENLRRTQNHLIQTEKMASLGSMVAGAAHEINTPLGIAVTAISNMDRIIDDFIRIDQSGTLRRQDLDALIDNLKAGCDIIEPNLERAARLVRSLKQVSVDQTNANMRRFRVAAYMDEVLVSLQPRLKKTNIIIDIECDSDLQITSDPGALAQILTNLIANSLEHAYEPHQNGKIVISARIDGDNFVLQYCDDGKGMAREVCDRVFEPFFTTRRGSGGTGLGLHVVYNLVTAQLHGEIECASEWGVGTVFHIRLPLENGREK